MEDFNDQLHYDCETVCVVASLCLYGDRTLLDGKYSNPCPGFTGNL